MTKTRLEEQIRDELSQLERPADPAVGLSAVPCKERRPRDAAAAAK